VRLREFKNPVLLEAAPAAAVVAAWPWLVGLFGAAGATIALQQNPQAVEDFSEWAVDSLPDARTMDSEDRNLIMSPYGSMIDGLGQAWDYITSEEEIDQAAINKRIDDALAAGAQRRGGERTEEILAKYRAIDDTQNKVDPKLQAAADAQAAEDEALISKILDKPTPTTPQTQAQSNKILDKIISQRTTPSAKAADPSDDAIADKMVTQPNQKIGRVEPVPIGQQPAKEKPSIDTPYVPRATSEPYRPGAKAKATPGGMADRKDGRTVAPDAKTAPLTKPDDIPSTAGVKPGEAPSAKGRDVAPPADVVKPGTIAKPDAGAKAKPDTGAQTIPQAIPKAVPRAGAVPKAAAPAQPAPVAPPPIAQPPAAAAKPGTIKKAPRLGGAVYTGSLKGTPPKNILRLK